MTLEIWDDLVQGEPEWHDARRGILTASTIGQMITSKTVKLAANDYSRGMTVQLVAERITKRSEFVSVTNDMERGNLDEPICRDAYTEQFGVSEQFGVVEQVGFMTDDIGGYKVGFSPDGLVGDDGLIEIKSRKAKKQISTFLDDAVPLENMAQIQTGLMISGRAWCDYLSWCGGLPMYRKRVLPDPRWFEVISEAVVQFERTAAEMLSRYETATLGLAATEYIDHFAEIELKL